MIQMICITNKTEVKFNFNGKFSDDEGKTLILDWLTPGMIYDVENIIGKAFIDVKTNELIDAIILKNFKSAGVPSKQGWLPANLFMDLEDWREQQLNKIL
jgi:hypothetical protein